MRAYLLLFISISLTATSIWGENRKDIMFAKSFEDGSRVVVERNKSIKEINEPLKSEIKSKFPKAKAYKGKYEITKFNLYIKEYNNKNKIHLETYKTKTPVKYKFPGKEFGILDIEKKNNKIIVLHRKSYDVTVDLIGFNEKSGIWDKISTDVLFREVKETDRIVNGSIIIFDDNEIYVLLKNVMKIMYLWSFQDSKPKLLWKKAE